MSITSNNHIVRDIINQVVNDPDYKQVSYVPLISLPQIALILIAYVGVIGSILLHLYLNIPIWMLYPVMIFCFFKIYELCMKRF